MKPDCYQCKYRRNVAGDCHSKCAYPGLEDFPIYVRMFSVSEKLTNQQAIINKLNIKASSHGIRNGWFCWPCNFDPVWLENCDGFKQKER